MRRVSFVTPSAVMRRRSALVPLPDAMRSLSACSSSRLASGRLPRSSPSARASVPSCSGVPPTAYSEPLVKLSSSFSSPSAFWIAPLICVSNSGGMPGGAKAAYQASSTSPL